MKFAFTKARRWLRWLPGVVATALAVAFIWTWPARLAPVVVLASYLVTGALIALVDGLIYHWRHWRAERRLVRSINSHPAGGRVAPGRLYVVGELGPDEFTPAHGPLTA